MKHVSILIGIVGIIALMLGATVFAQDTHALSGTAWQLVAIGDEAVVDGTTVTLIFDEAGRAGGSAGCNSYGTDYTVSGSDISFGLAVSTMMACMQDGVMEQEQAYLNALSSATSFTLAGGQLVITYGEGEQLVFASQVTLADSQWQLVSLGGADVVGGVTITLELGADGEAHGNTGCNIFRTTYTHSSGSISFSPDIITTRRACLDEGAAAQEMAYLDALGTATAYTLADDQLTITYGAGQEMVFVQMLTLANTAWQLETMGGAAVIEGSEITLSFDAEGHASGSGGCNLYGGSYSAEGSLLVFSEVVSTLRACLEDDLMAQEQTYFNALETATGYDLTTNSLTIFYGAGEQLTFVPAATASVTVEVTYIARIALPPQAEITVQLLDVSRMDVAADVLATETITADGAQVPFMFELPYDVSQIIESNRYAVRAEIRVDGDLMFTTDQEYAVITGDNPNTVTIELVMVDR